MTPTTCASHEPLLEKLSELTEELAAQRRDQGWLIRIGYGLFLIGLAVLTVALVTIFEAGSLKATVERNAHDIAHIEQRLDQAPEVPHAP